MPLPGVGGAAGTGLDTQMGGDSLRVGGGKMPDLGLTELPHFGAREHPLLVCTFFGRFYITGDAELCREDARGALLVNTVVLGTKSNLNSDASLSADSIRMALSLMSWSFLVHK